MHRVLKSHLDSFSLSHALDSKKESIQFEYFANYAVISSKISTSYDLDNVTTEEGDDGTDGVAVIIDEEIILSGEDAEQIFSTEKRNHDVDLVFVQAKTSESLDLGEFLKFKESVLRFVNVSPYNAVDEVQKAAREVFDVVIKKAPKVRNGKPSVTIRYVYAGGYQNPDALETAKREFESQLKELGLFDTIDIKFVDRDEVISLWVSTYSGTSAWLDMFSMAPLPKITDVGQAYIGVVKAKELVVKLLTSEDGNLRTHVFEENVRAFLGTENPVNHSIAETIKAGNNATRFPVLNNGITIASSKITPNTLSLHIENFSIVNGCQTSNVLFENKSLLIDDIMLTVKVVETTNEDVFAELVRATNSQTKVEETQFLSSSPIVKNIERYFNTFTNPDSRLYFERRDRQYIGKDTPALRVFSINAVAKCVGAMFFQRPDQASRYFKTLIKELASKIFAEGNKESMFYAACLTFYRFNLFVSSGSSQEMKRYKWHLLPLARAIVLGKEIPALNSKKMDEAATKLIAVMSNREQAVEVFNKAVEIIQSMGDITSDRLKRQTVLAEMLDKVPNPK